LPQELSADTTTVHLKLSPGQETQMVFKIHNFSALGGSTYPVYAILEYDAAGVHNTAIATSTIEISTGEKSFIRGSLILPVTIALVVLLVLLNVRFKRRPK
jgi:hypothetical protein